MVRTLFQEWFKTAQNPNSAAYHLLAVAYYQMGNHAAALEPAQKAVDLGGIKPQESWLQLLWLFAWSSSNTSKRFPS